MKKLTSLLIGVFLSGITLSQNTFKVNGNNLSTGDYLGSNNNQDLDIKTNGQLRFKFNSNGKMVAKDDFKVQGILSSDSLVTNGGAHIFGVLHVGNNSLILGGLPQPGNDNVQSSNGVINFGGNPIFPNINVSIGAQFVGPFTAARARLFVNGRTGMNVANPLSTLGINGNQAVGAGFSALNAPANGLIVEGFTGIATNNPVRQLELYTTTIAPQFRITRFLNTHFTDISTTTNGDFILLPTNTTLPVAQRPRYIGIQTNTPGNTLEINSQAPNTNQSFAGLRFTDLTASSPTLPAIGKVLSVDANGDVVLRQDGGSGGTATAKNGLNTTAGPPDIELGGPLIRHTNVTTGATGVSDMVFNGNGQFGIGNNLTAGSLGNGKIHFSNFHNGGSNIYNQGLVLDFTASAPLNTFVYGINNTVNVDNSSFTWGSYNTAQGNSQLNIGVAGVGLSNTIGGAVSNFGVVGQALDAALNTGGSFLAQATTGSGVVDCKGVSGEAIGGSSSTIGGYFSGTDNTSGDNTGVLATASNNFLNFPNSYNTGVYSHANSITGLKNHAVLGLAENGATSIGVAGIIGNNNLGLFYSPSGLQAGVYGYNPGGAASGNYAGYFDGDVNVNGLYHIGGVLFTSDQMFKTNIDTITNARAIIKQLKPKTFYFDTTNIYGLKFSGKKQIGFVAQDVQTVLPYLVGTSTKPASKDSLGNVVTPSVTYKTLNYEAFIALMMKGMQDQDKRIDSLVGVIASSSSRSISPTNNPVDNNSTTDPTRGVQTPVELSDKNVISLDNSIPNPWVDNTSINYNIPTTFSYAQIIFSTADGRIIKTVDIKEKGAGTLNVYAKDLSGGLYNYSLVVDGKVIDTKKMVKQ